MATLLSPPPSSPSLAKERQAYSVLRQRWRQDPRLYVRHRFNAQPTWQQNAILDAIAPSGAKVSVRSGHGIGKSSCAAWIIDWMLETHDYAKIPCTAPSSHQLRDVLWGELSKWRRIADTLSEARGDPPSLWLGNLFELTQGRLCDPGSPEWAAIARTAAKENPEALQGFHATHMMFCIDEASGVPEEIFEATEGALSTPGARVLMLGNPTRNTGTFAASHKQSRSEYTVLHFRSQDSPLVAPDYRERLVRKFGEGSNVVRVRADGEFPKQDDDSLISLEQTEACLEREPSLGRGPRRLGVDVARHGDDRTVRLLRHGTQVEHIGITAKEDTMQTVGRIVACLAPWRVEEVYVDVIGVGAGVYDRLCELRRAKTIRVPIYAVNVAQEAPLRTSELDAQGWRLRDHLWLEMAAWIRDEEPAFVAEDRDACSDLAGELATVKFKLDSSGRIVIESKDEMKKRLGHSSDLADSLGCTFCPSEGSPIIAPISIARRS